ncbi:sensor histidine kinase [Saccharobesus litoralis]|nr:histidine kinase [Saccharobesus litoralis]
MNNKIALQFFPQEKLFWLYHFAAYGLFTLFQSVNFYLREMFFGYNMLATAIMVPIFTFTVLLFRWVYKTRRWHELAMGKQMGLVLLSAFIMSIIVVLLLSITTLPFYWHDLFNEKIGKMAGFSSPMQGFLQFFVSNVIAQAFICGLWGYMYIGVSYSRRARQAELDVLRLENSLKEAQLISLSNQLNPHFLFNSLNNIRFLIHENPDQADDMVTAFSEILRYSLTQGKQEKVKLAQELEIVQRYIEIVSVQLEHRLDFQLTKPNGHGVDEYVLPPMTLQLLVENAIKHGVDNIRQASTLNVDISLVENQIFIQVVNPVLPHTNNIESTGTGLANIRQRLKLLYADNAELMTQLQDNQFTARLTLPAEK